MSEKDNISDKDMKDEAPILFNLPKKHVKAPDGYFEKLADTVMEKLEKEDHGTDVIPFSDKGLSKVFIWAAAAGIAALVGLFLINGDHANEQGSIDLAGLEINVEDDMDYLLEIEDDIVMDSYLAMDETKYDTEEIDFLMDEDFDYEDYINLDL